MKKTNKIIKQLQKIMYNLNDKNIKRGNSLCFELRKTSINQSNHIISKVNDIIYNYKVDVIFYNKNRVNEHYAQYDGESPF